jgi:transcription elongation factor GreA-like protein
MTDIWNTSHISELTDSDLKSFQDIVLRDVKNKPFTSEEKTILFNNLDLWLFCLRNLRKELELQLTQFKANTKAEIKNMRDNYASQDQIEEYIIEENQWRNNAIKFLTAIERKTLYVKLIISSE